MKLAWKKTICKPTESKATPWPRNSTKSEAVLTGSPAKSRNWGLSTRTQTIWALSITSRLSLTASKWSSRRSMRCTSTTRLCPSALCHRTAFRTCRCWRRRSATKQWLAETPRRRIACCRSCSDSLKKTSATPTRSSTMWWTTSAGRTTCVKKPETTRSASSMRSWSWCGTNADWRAARRRATMWLRTRRATSSWLTRSTRLWRTARGLIDSWKTIKVHKLLIHNMWWICFFFFPSIFAFLI